MKAGKTERVEVAVSQGLLDHRVSGHAPEPSGRAGCDRHPYGGLKISRFAG